MTTTSTITALSHLVVKARDIREQSFVPAPGPLYGHYAKTWDEATDEAIVNAGTSIDGDVRSLIWFLAISGEGSEICQRIIDRGTANAAAA